MFLSNNLDIVFFIYGLAFVVMGTAIFVQPCKQSIFKLGPILWLLGAFGLMHGINEWLDMWVIIKGQNGTIDLIRWFCLVISYVFLFEFARRIFRIPTQSPNNWQSRIASYLGWWLTLALVMAILIGGLTVTNFWQMGSALTRYLLAFPSGILIAIGFWTYYRHEHHVLNSLKMRTNFIVAGTALLIYGLIGGLIVPKGDFFPANWINTDSFILLTGIPVQVFRAGCAVAIAWAMMRILAIFNWEITDKIQHTLETQERVNEGISESIMLLTPDLRVLWTNKTLRNSTHLSEEELIGDFCYRVTHHLDQPCQPPHDTCPIAEMFKTGKPVKAIHTHYDKEGNKFYAEVTAFPVHDSKGGISQIIHVARDVTERIKSEEELGHTREQLMQSEKLSTMGQLAGGVAHDFNNLMMIISGNVYLLKSEVDPTDEQTHKMFDNIKRAVDRGTDLSQKLLGFARRGKYLPVPVNCNQIVEETVGMLSQTIEKTITIEQHLAPDLQSVEADKSQIHQVILNICINATQAITNKGKIIIETLNATIDEEYVRIHTDAKPGKFVVISISDTGMGMDKETIKHIFEPFFTTKKAGEGSGLGLAMVYGIVKNHNGFINVYSEYGKGSCFKVYLPASGKEASSKPSSHKIVLPQESVSKSGVILVVDDESGILEIARLILGKHGYEVLTAKSGPEAVSVYQKEKDRINLVILDLIMPIWDGKETYAKLKEINPAVKVLIASGYSISGQAQGMIDAGALGFIQKPFNIENLLREIKQHIGEKPS
ncbi:MAG: ATP-binding protein [Candidatus Brocadiia bacterium]